MWSLSGYIGTAVLTLAYMLLTGPLAQAHLMVAQHGTLNIVDDGVFMAVSLPISAFYGLDDDDNGDISMVEFNNHREAIVQSIKQGVTLRDAQGNCSLEGIMLSPVVSHDRLEEPISQLAVMGRFTLNGSDDDLRFHMGLYGKQTAEQQLEMTATRIRDNSEKVFELTPSGPARVIFPAGQPEAQKPVVWNL
jgi:hypothetical protein